MIHLKRAYDPISKSDGYRILVERLWPRGLSKEKAGIDLWLKEIAPSPELRKWYSHEPAKWEQFRQRYEGELKGNEAALAELERVIRDHSEVTFVYAAHDVEHNSALVLEEFLKKRR